MPRSNVTFKACLLDAPDYGSTEECMVSRVYFDLMVRGNFRPDLWAEVKQSKEGSFLTMPVEITGPRVLEPALRCISFRNAVEAYYKSVRGAAEATVAGGLSRTSRGVSMEIPANVVFNLDHSCEGESSGG